MNDVFVALGITDIILSATHLINKQKLRCILDTNYAYIHSERSENDTLYELDVNTDVIRLQPCTIEDEVAAGTTDDRLSEGTTALR